MNEMSHKVSNLYLCLIYVYTQCNNKVIVKIALIAEPVYFFDILLFDISLKTNFFKFNISIYISKYDVFWSPEFKKCVSGK